MRLIERIEDAIIEGMNDSLSPEEIATLVLRTIRDPGPEAINCLSGAIRRNEDNVYSAWRDLVDEATKYGGRV